MRRVTDYGSHRHEVTEFIIFVFQKSLKKRSNIFYVIYSDKSITRKLEMVLQSLILKLKLHVSFQGPIY